MLQLEEFKKKKAAAQAAKRATPLTTPQMTPVPTPIKAPENASRNRTPAPAAHRAQPDRPQALPQVDSKPESLAGNGYTEAPLAKVQQEIAEGAAASAQKTARVPEPEGTAVSLAVHGSSQDAAAPPVQSSKAAEPVAHDNGEVQHPSKGGATVVNKDTADLKGQLASQQGSNLTEVQQLRDALKGKEDALSNHTMASRRAAEKLQALLQQRDEEIERLRSHLDELQSSVEQRVTAAASEWERSKARLEEQVSS